MSKGGVKLPGGAGQSVPRQPSETARTGEPAPQTGPSKAKQRLVDNKRRVDRGPQRPQAPQRAQRGRGAGAAAGAHGAAGAAQAADDVANAEQQGVQALDGGENELGRRRHADGEMAWKEQILNEQHDTNVPDSGAIGPDAIKRSKGGDGQSGGGSDGFDQQRGQREAYERYLKGNVDADKERFDALRARGTKDAFQIDLPAKDVEALGPSRAAGHLVRLYDAWTLGGATRQEAVTRAAALLGEFASVLNIKKVLSELEQKPIRDVYPLEVLMHILDERPELLPGVRPGRVIGNADDLQNGKKVMAGHAVQVPVPDDTRLKAFALLGGARPGYEFYPTPGNEQHYTLLIDTPGTWTFSVLAAPLQTLGRIQRETQEALLEVFTVEVWAMDKKGEPLSAEAWRQRMEDDAALAEADDASTDDVADEPPDEAEAESGAHVLQQHDDVSASAVELAPLMALQLRKALDAIVRDAPSSTSAAEATTYSWVCELRKPGTPIDSEPVLRVVVDKANAFDPAWHRARETIAAKQRAYEPSRQPLTQDDLTNALRRARVR